MSQPHSVAEVLSKHVTLEREGIDRMYLNAYVPRLQRENQVAWYLREQHGARFASSALLEPITQQFLRAIDEFVQREHVPLVDLQPRQRKDGSFRTRVLTEGDRPDLDPGWSEAAPGTFDLGVQEA